MNDVVSRWARQSIELGGDNRFTPWVLAPAAVPEITDSAAAWADPELAVLSAVAHGDDADVDKVVQIALAAESALLGLDAERSTLYRDMLFEALAEAARQALNNMEPGKREYRSEFARRYYGQGLIEGRAELVLRQLTRRFGELPEAARVRIREATAEELDQIGDRLLTAGTLSEALHQP